MVPDKGSNRNSKRRGRGHGSGLGKPLERIRVVKDQVLKEGLGLKVNALSRRLPKEVSPIFKEFLIVNISKLDN